VAVTKGVGADRFLGVVFDPRSSALGRAITSGSTGRTHDLLTWAEPGFGARFDFGPALLAPLTAMDGQPGAILLIRQAHQAAFTADDLQLASTFAAQLAVVLELGDVRGEIEWLRAVEQRHQAARELHDDVMQRLFATGVGLQVLAERQPDETAREQMLRYIDDLDETIEQIRARVFRLYPEDEPPPRHSDGYCQDATRAADGRTFRATGADPAPMRTLEPSDVRRTDQPEVNAQPSTPVVAVSGSDSARRKER
jgi:hypothetical protein